MRAPATLTIAPSLFFKGQVPSAVAVAINPDTGLRDPSASNQIIEYFYHENVPPEPGAGLLFGGEPPKPPEEINDQLY